MKRMRLLAPGLAAALFALPAFAHAQTNFTFALLDSSSNVVPTTLTLNLGTVATGGYAAGQTINVFALVDTIDPDAAYFGNFTSSTPSINGGASDLDGSPFFTPSNGGFGPFGVLTNTSGPQEVLVGTFDVSGFFDALVAGGLNDGTARQTSFDFSLDLLNSDFDTIDSVSLNVPALVVTGAVTPAGSTGVPEPGTVALMVAMGVSGAGLLRRRRRA